MNEEWKPIIGWEKFYEISNIGNVRSKIRYSPMNSLHPDVLIKRGGNKINPFKSGCRYLVVNLTGGGKREKKPIHVAVLEAFVCQRPEGKVCCHYDGDMYNNNINNLRWDTMENNNKDKKRHGRYYVGQDHFRALLTNKQANRIKEYISVGIPVKELSSFFGVTTHTIYNIKYGKVYSQV